MLTNDIMNDGTTIWIDLKQEKNCNIVPFRRLLTNEGIKEWKDKVVWTGIFVLDTWRCPPRNRMRTSDSLQTAVAANTIVLAVVVFILHQS